VHWKEVLYSAKWCHSIHCKEVVYYARRFYTVYGGSIHCKEVLQSKEVLYSEGSIQWKEDPFYAVQGSSIGARRSHSIQCIVHSVPPGPKI